MNTRFAELRMPDPPDTNADSGRLFPEMYTPEYLEMRRRAVAEPSHWDGVDATDPKCAAGHARGIRISTSLTSDYRRAHRRSGMDIRPQDVIDVLHAANVKKWVLMGLHGYVGYLPQPRATQDVDVLISHHDRKRAVKAIGVAWPVLIVQELEPVIRFKDPDDCYTDGSPKPVIDLMLPWSQVNEAILQEGKFVTLDPDTGHRIPTLEAALVSKYSAMVSDYREWNKKEQDAVDFRSIARTNYQSMDRIALRQLGELVFEGGGQDLERFVEIAQRDEPFPI